MSDTAVETRPAATTESATVRRVLQRLVFPASGDTDVLPLYVDPDRAQLDYNVNGLTTKQLAKIVPPPPNAHEQPDPHAVVDRTTYLVPASNRRSFGTYFNAFPASYWRQWTVVTDVTLEVEVTGDGASVVVYRSMPDGRSQRVDDGEVEGDGPQTFSFDLSLKSFADGGWYWFDVIAGDNGARVARGTWSAEVPASHAAQGTVTIGITTMNRPDFCADLLLQLGEDAGVHEVLDEVVVVDQGTQKVSADDGFPAASEALGEKLRVIEQANLGGSGGYARAQAETLEAGRSTYMMCMDDDVVCEPESVVRAVTFGDLCRRPTLVGGHMFSLYAKSRLHSFGEIVQLYRFWWQSAPKVLNDWDFSERNLRSSRWLHRRVDVDFNGWFMCLIPTQVLREIGLSLPLFIKWDDSEYGLRAKAAGYPTVSFPGAAVWHVPWSDKNDAVDWQAYYHQRNRLVAALLHSPYEHGGRLVLESFNHQVKHVFALQYSTAELRQLALEDLLRGPEHLHAELGTKLPELRELRQRFPDAQVASDPDAFPQPRRAKPAKKGQDPTAPQGRLGFYLSAAKSLVRQGLPKRPLSSSHPEVSIASMDAPWWIVSKFDSLVVTMPDGAGATWRHRDSAEAADLMRRTAASHAELWRDWDALAARYRAHLEDITSPSRWGATFSEEDETR